MPTAHRPERRRFLQAAACVAAGAGFSVAPTVERAAWSREDDLHFIGPKPGYAPELGTLATMMAFMRNQVVHPVAGMKTDAGRKTIKGHDLDFYLTTLPKTRAHTLVELKKRDDKWPFAVDPHWPWGPTNNYCKWFHVCEHEANHNGQIKFLERRLPGATPAGAG